MFLNIFNRNMDNKCKILKKVNKSDIKFTTIYVNLDIKWYRHHFM